jgi:hypothetical protein
LGRLLEAEEEADGKGRRAEGRGGIEGRRFVAEIRAGVEEEAAELRGRLESLSSVESFLSCE